MLDLVDLKDAIKNNTLTIDFIVFICKDGDHYLANQYINEICSNRGYSHNIIESLNEVNSKSALALVEDYSYDLNILRVDEFAEEFDYTLLENTVVVCDKVNKKIVNRVDSYCVEMPKLLEWQIKSHCYNLCPTINPVHLDWLYGATNGNIARLDNELDKIKMFDLSSTNNLLVELKNDDNTDLFSLSTFTFVDAVIKSDYITVAEALTHKKCWDSDPMFILTLLLNKYKQIVLVHGNSGVSAEQMGVSPKALGAIRYYYKGFDLNKIRDKIAFLSNINLRINLGEFDCGSSETFLDYIVCNVM